MAAPKRTRDATDRALARAEAAVLAPGAPEVLLAVLRGVIRRYRSLERKLLKTTRSSDGHQERITSMTTELERLSSRLRQFREVGLPVCAHCRKVRLDDQYWQRLETFLARNPDIMLAQSLCPECGRVLQESPSQSSVPGIGPEGVSPGREHLKKTGEEDPHVARLRALAAEVARDAPQHAREMEAFAERYAKVSRRFTKTLTISDSYQLQLRDLNEQLERMARTDLLTGLANRWEIASRLETERSRMERYGSVFSLILGDVDHFKAINDTFGHQGGDCALRHVADTLRRNLRAEDLCARWGGEEFLMLLPETDLDQAGQVAGKLHALVGGARIAWESSTIRLTMSFGVTAFQPGLSLDEGVKRVDDALYAAKERGRNQVVIADR